MTEIPSPFLPTSSLDRNLWFPLPFSVPLLYHADPSLGRWVNSQRTCYRRQTLRQERIQALESIGFEWRLKDNPPAVNMPENDSNWEAMFGRLETYKEEYGDVNVPRSFPQDQMLSRWVQAQRRAKQLGHMPEDRHYQLDSIGFVWDNSDNGTNVFKDDAWDLQVSLVLCSDLQKLQFDSSILTIGFGLRISSLRN